jgi:hypothetical protein
MTAFNLSDSASSRLATISAFAVRLISFFSSENRYYQPSQSRRREIRAPLRQILALSLLDEKSSENNMKNM